MRAFEVTAVVLCGLAIVGAMIDRPVPASAKARQISAGACCESLNVKDYGAVGDGTTDDTIAIQACATAAAARVVKWTPAGGSGEATIPRVCFPAGRYVTSSVINWGAYAQLEGSGKASIEATHGGDVFAFATGADVQIANLTFIRGGTAIRYSNNNANGSRLDIEDCRFQLTEGAAIHVAPVTGNYLSTWVTIRDCKAFNCRQFLVSWADVNNVEACWLQWGGSVPLANTSHIEIRGGRLNFRDTMLVPVFATSNWGCSWIALWGFPERNSGCGVFCDRVQFHGEYGGLPCVAVWAVPDLAYPFMGPVIEFKGCQLSAGQANRADSAVVQLQGGLPQTVSIDASSNLISPVPIILDVAGTGPATFASLVNGPQRVRITLGTNGFWTLTPSPSVPAFLAPYFQVLTP